MISAYSFRKAYFVLVGGRWGEGTGVAVYGECALFPLANIGVVISLLERQVGEGVPVNV